LQEGTTPPTAPPRRIRPLIAAGAALGALLAIWLIQRRPAAAPAAPASKPATARAPMPPPVVVPLPPKTLATFATRPQVALPSAPPLRVSLVVPAGDRGTRSRFDGLAARLRQAGFTDVHLESIDTARRDTRALRHHVVYFFGQDAPLAKNVAGALDSAEDPSHIADPWALILVPEAAGSASQPPGSIDVFGP